MTRRLIVLLAHFRDDADRSETCRQRNRRKFGNATSAGSNSRLKNGNCCCRNMNNSGNYRPPSRPA